jgi:hypothetical protein
MRVITYDNLNLGFDTGGQLKPKLIELLGDPLFRGSPFFDTSSTLYDRFRIVDVDGNYVEFCYHPEYNFYLDNSLYRANTGIHYVGSTIHSNQYLSCVNKAILDYQNSHQMSLFDQ